MPRSASDGEARDSKNSDSKASKASDSKLSDSKVSESRFISNSEIGDSEVAMVRWTAKSRRRSQFKIIVVSTTGSSVPRRCSDIRSTTIDLLERTPQSRKIERLGDHKYRITYAGDFAG